MSSMSDGLDAAIEAGIAAFRSHKRTDEHGPIERAVRAAYPHIRRAVLTEAADAVDFEMGLPLSNRNIAEWLRERAEEGGDG